MESTLAAKVTVAELTRLARDELVEVIDELMLVDCEELTYYASNARCKSACEM